MWYLYMLKCIILFVFCFILCCLLFQLSFEVKSVSYFSSRINKRVHHTAIILARIPSIKVLKHLNALVNAGVDAFVMCDEEPSKYTNSTNRTLYVNNEQLARYGLTRNRVWDRVFVWLYNQSSIDYVWLMEDDVTWSNVHHIVNLFNTYAYNQADLLSRNIIYKNKHTLG
ncbi:unnamed protein product, partial [Rotaria sp. Silwood2]